MDKVILVPTLCSLILTLTCSGVLSAPGFRGLDSEDDPVEQELIRHHHSTVNGNTDAVEDDALSSTDDRNDINSNTFPTASNGVGLQHNNDVTKMFEDSLYDITVGDVIYDVLLTLRDHPEIVKELMRSEQSELEEINAAKRSANENRERLNGHIISAPKRVEKKAGNSGMPEKRQSELTNDAFTGHDHDNQLLTKRTEEESDEEFNYKQFISDSTEDTESTDDSSETDDTRSHDDRSTESDENIDLSNEREFNVFRNPFMIPLQHRFPHMYPLAVDYKLRMDSSDSSDHSDKWRHHKNKHDSETESESDTSESVDEDQLFKLMYDKSEHNDHQEENIDSHNNAPESRILRKKGNVPIL